MGRVAQAFARTLWELHPLRESFTRTPEHRREMLEELREAFLTLQAHRCAAGEGTRARSESSRGGSGGSGFFNAFENERKRSAPVKPRPGELVRSGNRAAEGQSRYRSVLNWPRGAN